MQRTAATTAGPAGAACAPRVDELERAVDEVAQIVVQLSVVLGRKVVPLEGCTRGGRKYSKLGRCSGRGSRVEEHPATAGGGARCGLAWPRQGRPGVQVSSKQASAPRQAAHKYKVWRCSFVGCQALAPAPPGQTNPAQPRPAFLQLPRTGIGALGPHRQQVVAPHLCTQGMERGPASAGRKGAPQRGLERWQQCGGSISWTHSMAAAELGRNGRVDGSRPGRTDCRAG